MTRCTNKLIGRAKIEIQRYSQCVELLINVQTLEELHCFATGMHALIAGKNTMSWKQCAFMHNVQTTFSRD